MRVGACARSRSFDHDWHSRARARNQAKRNLEETLLPPPTSKHIAANTFINTRRHTQFICVDDYKITRDNRQVFERSYFHFRPFCFQQFRDPILGEVNSECVRARARARAAIIFIDKLKV